MSSNKNDSTTAGARRSQLRQQLTVAWVKKNKPEVYEAIEEFAASKIPYVGRGTPRTTELPPELANLR